MSQASEIVERAIAENEQKLVDAWIDGLESAPAHRREHRDPANVRDECQRLVAALRSAAQAEGRGGESGWSRARQEVDAIARERVREGTEPAQTAAFLGALRPPLFRVVGARAETEAVPALLSAMELLDRVQERLVHAYIELRDEVIQRHQEEVLELSTPVVKLWDGILALPLIGTLDSRRAQLVLETLLERIAATGSRMAIIDITGVPTVDTLVAQNLIKAVTATKLMGAECILSGIRPQIAQTIVQLGVDLSEVTTKSSLADAFLAALERFDYTVERAESGPS